MALASSGPISLSGSVSGQSIYLELQSLYTGNPTISLQDSYVKGLAQKPSSNLVTIPDDFYNKQKTMVNAVLDKSYICKGSATSTQTTTIANQVTATVTGGIYPLTYSWSRTAGDPSITALASTSATTRFTASGISQCTSITATFRCTITDFTGATINTGTVDVELINTTNIPGDPSPCTYSTCDTSF